MIKFRFYPNLSFGYVLRVFLNFGLSQPRCSYKKIGYTKGSCVDCMGYNVATHLHNSFALTDLQPDRINVGYHRYPTQNDSFT